MRTACAGDRARTASSTGIHALSPALGAFVVSRGRRRRSPHPEGDPWRGQTRQAAVAEIVESFNDAAGAVLTEYRGLTVKQLQDLRRSLGENANYAVVKNTLAKIAANEAGIDGFDDLLDRPDRDRLHQRRRGRGGQGSA